MSEKNTVFQQKPLDELITRAEEIQLERERQHDWNRWLEIMTERCETELKSLGYDVNLKPLSDDALEKILFELLEREQARVNAEGRAHRGNEIIDEAEDWEHSRELDRQRQFQLEQEEKKKEQLKIERELKKDSQRYSQKYRLNYEEIDVDNQRRVKLYNEDGSRKGNLELLYMLIRIILGKGDEDWFREPYAPRPPRISDEEFRKKYNIPWNWRLTPQFTYQLGVDRYGRGSEEINQFWFDYFRTYESDIDDLNRIGPRHIFGEPIGRY